jgi:hypothetical protein
MVAENCSIFAHSAVWLFILPQSQRVRSVKIAANTAMKRIADTAIRRFQTSPWSRRLIGIPPQPGPNSAKEAYRPCLVRRSICPGRNWCQVYPKLKNKKMARSE